MKTMRNSSRASIFVTFAAAALLLTTYSSMSFAGEVKVTLGGDQEVPAVMTSASGSGTIMINDDRTVQGSVATTGIEATAAHIHVAATGKNGPVIIPLKKSGENMWSVPAGAKLTEAQYKEFKAGGLYVNVHSAAHKGGEIRGQLNP